MANPQSSWLKPCCGKRATVWHVFLLSAGVNSFLVACVIIVVILMTMELLIDTKLLQFSNASQCSGIIHWISLSILSLFFVETLLRIIVLGIWDYIENKVEVLDGAVIILSLAPMVASTVANGPSSPWDAISLFISLRIWRLKRILDAYILPVKLEMEIVVQQYEKTKLIQEEQLERLTQMCQEQAFEIRQLRAHLAQQDLDLVAERERALKLPHELQNKSERYKVVAGRDSDEEATENITEFSHECCREPHMFPEDCGIYGSLGNWNIPETLQLFTVDKPQDNCVYTAEGKTFRPLQPVTNVSVILHKAFCTLLSELQCLMGTQGSKVLPSELQADSIPEVIMKDDMNNYITQYYNEASSESGVPGTCIITTAAIDVHHHPNISSDLYSADVPFNPEQASNSSSITSVSVSRSPESSETLAQSISSQVFCSSTDCSTREESTEYCPLAQTIKNRVSKTVVRELLSSLSDDSSFIQKGLDPANLHLTNPVGLHPGSPRHGLHIYNRVNRENFGVFHDRSVIPLNLPLLENKPIDTKLK